MSQQWDTLEERLWARVDRSGGQDACWPWLGPVNKGGYGQIQRNGKVVGVHRAAYEVANGPIPEGFDVCHNCPDGDNPACCNPAHLWLGTHAENMADMGRKGRAYKMTSDQNYKVKLTEKDVIAIRAEAAKGVKQKDLAEAYKVSPECISLVVNRVNWKYVA